MTNPFRASPAPGRGRLIRLHVNNKGQALAEAAIAIPILVILTVGIIEVSRSYLILNLITHAARDGARAAAVAERDNRDADGMIQDTSEYEKIVNDLIEVAVPDASSFDVAITQPTIDSVRMVQVRVQGSLDTIFGLFPASFGVDRVITFRDEGRRDPPTS